MFQFYNSAIKTKLKKKINQERARFQFYNSAIKTICFSCPILIFSCFNSTIVRLRRKSRLLRSRAYSLFQFYNSAIKTHCTIDVGDSENPFQFYNSAIKTLLNKILKQEIFLFQFYNSAIKTCTSF